MKKLAYIIVIFSILVFAVSFFVLRPLEKKTFFAEVNITDEAVIGFDTNNSALVFGVISLGSSATRNIILNNTHDFPVFVLISAQGDIASLMIFEKKVKINPKGTKSVSFSVRAPKDIEKGIYSGRVIFKILRDRNL